MKRIFSLSLLLTLAVGSTGCSTNFPYGVSWDRHNFLSTVHRPLSLELMDTVTKEVVWSLDIPVNKKAVVDLDHKQDWTEGFEPALPAHQISWRVMDVGTKVNVLDGTQELNGNPVLLKVKVRKAPELPVPDPPVAKHPDTPAVRPGVRPPGLEPKVTPHIEPTTVQPEAKPEPAPEAKPEPAPEAKPAPEPKPDAPAPEDLEGALEK